MQGVPDAFDHPADRARFRRLAGVEGIELYRAHIVRHAFEPHAHDGFGLGAIHSGVERFRYRGSDHLAGRGSLVLMNPEVLHTGRAESDGGWRYRMVYIAPALVEAISGQRGWWFAQPVGHDPATAQRLAALLDALWAAADDALAAQGLLLETLQLLQPWARANAGDDAPAGRSADRADARALALMHDRLADPLQLDELAAAAGFSPFHFQRRFKAQQGVTPHQMLMALRLARAKQLLAAGRAPAAVAAEVGLADQAHLTRRFARMYGVTPARYQRQLGL
ncbi:AraC family transcriptional regulator [Aquincola sp. S2]|uniref:AraC family transcriptional regulator n=1 Tax=Pseudaquabacterium terrae TaxID=2732868 RepID=A0ABX2ELS3_9BURK|nr:AraC family transcriptional regulator [Aquabacterium terrae]NRF69612.1 AraC family transcriptional regulator [Aquabacterium terrae]